MQCFRAHVPHSPDTPRASSSASEMAEKRQDGDKDHASHRGHRTAANIFGTTLSSGRTIRPELPAPCAQKMRQTRPNRPERLLN
jgi:hypothetical protein